MNACLYLTNRVKYKWPKEYEDELIGKLKSKGHNVFVVSDDTPEHTVRDTLEDCEAFLGVLSPFEGIPFNGKRIVFRAASEAGEGPLSTMQCAGCEEKLPDRIDCLWEDELCMKEVTPNDVLGYL